jgi:hypothetical protein
LRKQAGLRTIADPFQAGRMALTCRFQSKGGVLKVCGYGAYGGRRYLTKQEKIEWLEEYKSNLEKELAGVTERIEELKH